MAIHAAAYLIINSDSEFGVALISVKIRYTKSGMRRGRECLSALLFWPSPGAGSQAPKALDIPSIPRLPPTRRVKQTDNNFVLHEEGFTFSEMHPDLVGSKR